MQLFDFEVSFSLYHHFLADTRIYLLNRAAKFVISVLYCVSTELR